MATAATVYRDYETDGIPSSGNHKVRKSDIRQLLTGYEGLINAFVNVNGGLIFASKASIDASLNYTANTMAWVIGDATAANNGVYMKVGASGTGSWTRVSDLPFSFVIASDVGAGTPNAIQATTSIPVSGSALVWTNIFEANTASPVTISFNGGSALTIKTNSGNNIAAGGLVAGMIVLGIVSGSTFRLVSDQASAAIVAAAEAILAEFKTTYYGPLAADPPLNPEGGAVKQGDLYFNTTSQVMKYYSGSAWVSIQAPDPYASDAEATSGTATNRNMNPAKVKKEIETVSLTLDQMSNPETLAAIVNRTGLAPQMLGAQASDTNHSPMINAAIDRLITAGGGTLWLPPISGDWKIGTAISCHKTGYTGSYLKVRGLGDKARLKWLNTTGDMIQIGNGTNPVYYVTLENLYLYAGGGARTSGIDIKAIKANVININDVVTDGSYAGFYGEDLNSVYHKLVHYNMPNQTTGAGVTVRSNPAGSGRTDIVKFDEVTVQAYNAGSYGLIVDGRVAGVHTDGFYALGCNRGLQLTSSATTLADVPNFCDFRKFEVDRALNIGVVIEKAYRTEFSRCDISNTSGAMDVPYPQGSNDDCAMFLGTGAWDTKVIGGRIGNCRTQAVNLQGRNTKFVGTTFNDMSKIGTAGAAAVYIAATANGFNFRDCTVEGFSRASYAFQVEAAAKNGSIRDTLYKDVVTAYATSFPATVSNAGQILCDYTY